MIFLHRSKGTHVWLSHVVLSLLRHLWLRSTSHPYTGRHPLYIVRGMVRSPFAWLSGRMHSSREPCERTSHHSSNNIKRMPASIWMTGGSQPQMTQKGE